MEEAILVLRRVLQAVPVERRREWRISDLGRWWNDASVYNRGLDASTNSISWEDVKRACADLIGVNAAS